MVPHGSNLIFELCKRQNIYLYLITLSLIHESHIGEFAVLEISIVTFSRTKKSHKIEFPNSLVKTTSKYRIHSLSVHRLPKVSFEAKPLSRSITQVVREKYETFQFISRSLCSLISLYIIMISICLHFTRGLCRFLFYFIVLH